MRRFVSPAVILLGIQMLGIGIFLRAVGKLTPLITPDTASYVEFSFGSWTESLGRFRTPGYPLFLKVVGCVTPDYSAAPLLQFLAYCLGVILFHRGLRHVCPGEWRRVAISSSLLYANILHGYVDTLATDTLAAAGGIGVAGLLLGCQTGPARKWPSLVAIGLATFLTCLIRPAYLFLVVFVPLAGMLLSMICLGRTDTTLRQGRKALAELLPVTLVPLLAYCLLRWCVVGQFGLVSFGGYNLIGLSGQWLDEEVLPELPAASRPLAELALQRQRLVREQTPVPRAGDRMSYTTLEMRYDETIWRVFQPAAEELYGADHRRINTELRRLATALVWARPKLYVLWLAKSARQAVRITVSDLVTNPVYLLLTITCVLAQIASTLSSSTARPQPETEQTNREGPDGALLLLAVSYAAFNLLLVILVCPPLGRLSDAAAVLLPTILVSFLVRPRRHCGGPTA
ncbi:MAG: hypothetical protein AABP62_03065 [Planctomycetota bacterium]